MPKNAITFNLNQLATWKQARECASKLSAGPIVVGLGVKPEVPGYKITGIYRPIWLAGPGSFEEPQAKIDGWDYFFLHLRFKNGGEGMNVGLIIDKFRRYPTSPLYVLSELAKEAETLQRSL